MSQLYLMMSRFYLTSNLLPYHHFILFETTGMYAFVNKKKLPNNVNENTQHNKTTHANPHELNHAIDLYTTHDEFRQFIVLNPFRGYHNQGSLLV